MIAKALPLLVALAAPLALAAAAPAQRPSRVVVTQLTIHERITIRVPRMNVPGRVALTAPTVWKESKGPKCIAAASLAGAMVSAPATIDLVVQGGQRIRAKLGRQCRSVDFYSNFYIRPGSDGQVCADRDTIRVRSGASCEIDSFKLLKPVR